MLSSASLSKVWLNFMALTPVGYSRTIVEQTPRLPSSERIAAGEHPIKVWMETRGNIAAESVARLMNLHGAPGKDAGDIERMASMPVADIPARDLIAFCQVVQITPDKLLSYKLKDPAPGSVVEAAVSFLHHASCAYFVRGEMSRSMFMETAHHHLATNQQILDAVNKLARVIGQAPAGGLSSPAAYVDDFERRLDAVDRYLAHNDKMNGLVYARADFDVGGAIVDLSPQFKMMDKRFAVDVVTNGKKSLNIQDVNAAWLAAFRSWRSHPKTSCFLKSEANRLFIQSNACAMQQLSMCKFTGLRAG